MDYKQALEWVHSLPRVASSPKLDKMRQLMAALGNPQRRLRFVHVAGTNGKGSTVAMLSAVLAAAGYKTGCNLSPYVLSFRERFQINGQMVPREELAEILTAVRGAAATLWEAPKEFEAVTAAAFLYFAQNGCDVVVMEAGVGGLYDPTNIVEHTLVACLLRVGYDHTELLGDILEKIAGDKSGIIKPGCTVVSYPAQPPEAANTIAAAAQKQNCPLVVPDISNIKTPASHLPFENPFCYDGIEANLHLPGHHQLYNASVVVAAARALRAHGLPVADDAISEGLAAARFPARIEVVHTRPLVLLDGAHNGDSATALADTLRAEGARRMPAIIGMLGDKDATALLQSVAPYIGHLYTVAPGSPRALPAQTLAGIAAPLVPRVTACESVQEAVQLAASGGDGLFACGSLYLASEIRPLLLSLYG